MLVDWRQVANERGKLVWEGLSVAVFTGWSGDWSIQMAWQRASYLAQLDPRKDPELEAHRQLGKRTEGRERPAKWLAGQPLPQPGWLDLRASTDSWAPRTPALLTERRPHRVGQRVLTLSSSQ